VTGRHIIQRERAFLVGAKRIEQMRVAVIQLDKQQLGERTNPLSRIFAQQQIKIRRTRVVLDYMCGKHATMRS
jgi:hypothetical protein